MVDRDALPGTPHPVRLRLLVWAIGALVVTACQQPATPLRADTLAAEPQAVAGEPDFSSAGLQAAEVRQFLTTLQQAVRRDDRQAVAALVAYPITVRIDGAPTILADPPAFIEHYPQVISEPVRAAIEAALPATLFANWQGIMIGRGELWFAGVYEDGAETYEILIIAINPG